MSHAQLGARGDGTRRGRLVASPLPALLATAAPSTAPVVESELPGDQNAARLMHCLLVSADPLNCPGRDPVFGKGRLNVLGAAECRRLE